MKMKQVMLFPFLALVLTLALYGQVQFQQVTLPAPVNGVYDISTTSEGTLQAAFALKSGGATLLAKTSPNLEVVQLGKISLNGFTGYELPNPQGAINAWGFSQQPGNTSYFGDGQPVNTAADMYTNLQSVLTRATLNPPALQAVCTGYTLDGISGNLPFIWRGYSYDSAGNLYASATPKDHSGSTVYRLLAKDIPPTTGICKFASVAKSDQEILQAFPLYNGNFLAQRINDIAVINGSVVAIQVSSKSASKPLVLSEANPSIVWNQDLQIGIICYNAGGQGHCRPFQGKLQDEFVDDNIQKLGNSSIKALDVKGNYALISVSSYPWRLLTLDLTTKNSSVTMDTSISLMGGFIPYPFGMGNTALCPDGTIYFWGIPPAGGTPVLFQRTIQKSQPPIITSFAADMTTVNAGDSTTLRWSSIANATSASVTADQNGLGSADVNGGSMWVNVSTTTTYTLTAVGPGGTVTKTVTVTAIPIIPTPQITALSDLYLGSKAAPKTSFATGADMTIWGNNLCNEFPLAMQLPITLPLKSEVHNCSFVLKGEDGKQYQGKIYIVTPQQWDIQLPVSVLPGNYNMVVRNGSASSAPVAIQITPIGPNFAIYTSGSTDYLSVLHQDGSLVSSLNPARGGEIVSIYLTGLGATDPVVEEGTAAVAPVTAEVIVLVNDTPAKVFYAGLQGQYPGLYQINVQVPATEPYANSMTIRSFSADKTVKTEDTLQVEGPKQK